MCSSNVIDGVQYHLSVTRFVGKEMALPAVNAKETKTRHYQNNTNCEKMYGGLDEKLY